MKAVTMNHKLIVLPTKDGLSVIPSDDIVYCEERLTSSVFFLVDGTQYESTAELSFFESKLKEWNFVRLHKSRLVNMLHATRMRDKKPDLLLEKMHRRSKQ